MNYPVYTETYYSKKLARDLEARRTYADTKASSDDIGQRDINKAQCGTIMQLSRALRCNVEDLVEYHSTRSTC